MTWTVFVILYVLLIHWTADFVCQTDWMAKNKSSNNFALLSHVMTYSAIMFIFTVVVINSIYYYLTFIVINAILHFITDYYTSRLNSKFWAKGDTHNFFVSVGFDQFIHQTTLILTTVYILLGVS